MDATYTKDDYRAAIAAVVKAEKAMNATPEWKAVEAARDRLDAIRDELGDAQSCEACSALIFDDEPYSYDTEGGVILCVECTPTWADLQSDPSGFYWFDGDEPVFFTAETAAEAIRKHLEAGGSLDDKFGLTVPEVQP